ncbi:MAG TPA: RNA methyltransferase [Xanthomonadaceae bacterium]|nr:RNA methyltransferase [Xanthomonadaceae bacterium]
MNLNSQFRLVLVGTSHPGNVGAAARAMKTMGLSRLVLVNPQAFPHEEATALASGADDLLETARVHTDLDAALADCRFALGSTARRRGVSLPEFDPRQAAGELLRRAEDGEQVALVFGSERVGLTNIELERCHGAVCIPSVTGFSSLNLAQAVQVLCYELRMAVLARGDEPTAAFSERPRATASLAELEGMFGHLTDMLEDIDFHKGRSPDIVLRRLRRLFQRAELDAREIRILRGIFAEAQRVAKR